jgi:hypothetical protein
LPSFEPNDATGIWEGGEVLGESSSTLPPIDLEVSLSRAAHAGKRNRGSQAEDRDGTHTSTVREEVHPVERAYERALSRMKDFKSILINSSLSNKIILYFVFLVCRHHST